MKKYSSRKCHRGKTAYRTPSRHIYSVPCSKEKAGPGVCKKVTKNRKQTGKK